MDFISVLSVFEDSSDFKREIVHVKDSGDDTVSFHAFEPCSVMVDDSVIDNVVQVCFKADNTDIYIYFRFVLGESFYKYTKFLINDLINVSV